MDLKDNGICIFDELLLLNECNGILNIWWPSYFPSINNERLEWILKI